MRLVAALLVLLAVVFAPMRAAAADVVLPVDRGFPAIVAGDPPSPQHPKGTVLVLHLGASELAAFEWDVALRRVVRRKSLGPITESASVVRAVRAGGHVFAVVGPSSGDDAVVLLRMTPELSVEARQEIGRGAMPSIAADASTIVTAFFEERPAISAPEGRSVVLAPPTQILNVQAREATTFKLAAASYFGGGGRPLLAPHGMPGLAARAVAMHDGRVTLALPLRGATRLVTARLPHLAIESDRELPWKDEPFGSMALVHVGAGVLGFGRGKALVIAGAPSLSATAERFVQYCDDAIVAGQRIHRLTHDAEGKVELETMALGTR